MNLITNASDALPDSGGTITLRTGEIERGALADVQFGAVVGDEDPRDDADQRFVYLEVGDTGMGMTRDTLRRIFDPFFSTKFAGRGLGLSAVMGIVRSHQGLIRIRTEPGQGTSFRLLFPAVAGAARKPEKPSAARSEWKGQGNVLVVDDEEGVRDVAVRVLQELGFDTLTAVDGRDALDLVDRVGDRITAVLLDLSMPRMGGQEAFRHLREAFPNLPIIMMSGYSEQVVASQFSRSEPGITAFLQKPFLAEDLIGILRQVVEVAV